MVRAKMMVTKISDNRLHMSCVYDPELKVEDRSFMEATPWGELTMGIDNPKALVQFTMGKTYYIDFTPAE